ncbi:MAG: hypothetical protein QM756_03265 [Polyangiaceae bacterium]
MLLIPHFDKKVASRIREKGPRRGQDEVFEQNWLWGQQWKAHDPKNRVVLELPFDVPLGTLELALQIAAATAHDGKNILLLTGHGSLQVGAFSETAFDTLPERGKMATHKHLITAQVLDLPNRADKVNDRWVARKGRATDEQAQIDRLAPRFDLLERVGAVFKKQKVNSFTVMSCNVGNDTVFQSELAKLLQVKVKMYSELLAMGVETFSNPSAVKVLAWLVPDHDTNPEQTRPNLQLSDGTLNRNHAQFHGPPPGLRTRSP